MGRSTRQGDRFRHRGSLQRRHERYLEGLTCHHGFDTMVTIGVGCMIGERGTWLCITVERNQLPLTEERGGPAVSPYE